MAFTAPGYVVNNIQGLATITKGQAAAVKVLHDKAGADTKTYIIALLAELAKSTAGSSASENLGSAPISGVAGTTIYAQLVALKGVVDSLVLGAIPLNSIGTTQLNFDPATQAELDAVESALTSLISAKASQTYAYENRLRSYMGV